MADERIVFDYLLGEGDPFNIGITPPKKAEIKDEEIDETLEDDEKTVGQPTVSETEPSEPEEIPEEEREPSEEEEEEGTEEEVNVHYYIAKQLASEGVLPKDFEVFEDVSYFDVVSQYKKKLEESTMPELLQRAKQKVIEEGFEPELATYVRALRNGVNPNLLTQAGVYEAFANLANQPDVDDDVKLQTIKAAHTHLKQLSEKESNRLIEFADENGELESLYEESVSLFGNKWKEWKKQESELHRQKQEEQQQAEAQAKQKIKSILSSGEILGEKISPVQAKEIENALDIADRIINIQGSQYQVSEIQEFLINFQSSEEMKLFAFKKWKYREQDLEQIKTEVKQEIGNELEKAMRQRIITDKKAIRKKQVKKELDQESQEEGRRVLTIEM